jgi:hypothetical protein
VVGDVQLEGDEEKSKSAILAVIITIVAAVHICYFNGVITSNNINDIFMAVSFIHPHKGLMAWLELCSLRVMKKRANMLFLL